MNCVADAVALVKKLGAERWVGFNDGNLPYLAELKRLAPGIPVFWDRRLSDLDEDLLEMGIDRIYTDYPRRLLALKAIGTCRILPRPSDQVFISY